MSELSPAADAGGVGEGLSAPADPMAEVLDLMTYRLRVDPELRLEVRRELGTHLDESIAELRRAGRSEADARAQAVAALGDPQELAASLFDANRRRIRMRAAAAWTTRLVLPPLAVALLVALAYHALVAWSVASVTFARHSPRSLLWIEPPLARALADRYRDKALSAAPADVRALMANSQIALHEQAKDRPSDLALYAQYAAAVSEWLLIPPYPGDRPDLAHTDPVALSASLETFGEGERREPDNALYPLLTAATLLDVSTNAKYYESLTLHRPDRKGEDEEWPWWRLEVTDPQRYASALDALHRAAHKPYSRSYTAAALDRRIEAIPVRRLADVWLRADQELSAPRMLLFEATALAGRAAMAATEAARAGHRDEAERLLRDLRLISIATTIDGADTNDMLQLYDDARMADEGEARVRQALGDAAGAEAMWKKMDQRIEGSWRAFGGAAGGRGAVDQTTWAGLLYANVRQSWSRSARGDDVAPMRRAEYAVADQLGVAALSAVVLILAMLYGAWGFVGWLRMRRRDHELNRPPRLTLGWRRIAAIVVLAVVLPVTAYLAYTRVTPLSGRGWGLNVQMRRVVIEYTVLGVVIVVLVSYLARRAVWSRAAEVGLAVPSKGWRARPLRRTLLGAGAALLALACLVGVISLAFGSGRDGTWLKRMQASVALAMLVMCWVLVGGAVLMLRDRTEPARRLRSLFSVTVARSAFPIILLAALVLAIVGLPLRWSESRAVAQVVAGNASPPSLSETEAPGVKAFRDQLRAEHDALLALPE